MRENDSSRRKGLGDESGFTLVELIITIAILAIITMPILNYFTDSAKHNAESRRKQNATVAAQDILEDFKNTSYSLDDASVVCSADPDWTVSAPQSAVGEKYSLTKTETIDRHSFSVTAEIDPLPSSAPVSYKEYVIGTMDTTKDVMASEHGQALLNAQAAFYGKYKANATTLLSGADSLEKFKNLLNCEIIVSAEKDPADANNKIIRVTYSYTYNNKLGALEGINSGVSSDYTYTEEIQASSIPAADMQNIYLFYTPLNVNDTITFKFQKNKNNEEVVKSDFGAGASVNNLNLFVVAQNSLDDAGNVVSGVPDPYGLKIVSDSDAQNFADAIAKVYTNLDSGKIDESTPIVAGKVEYSLVHGDSVNRLADIKVTVKLDSKEYVEVSGTKIQN
jgi:prepilin-type N-terminal cleavage/methylation domain-containing protein